MNVLDIQGLRLRLPGTARPVLDGVDLTVDARETVALVGESGSGKSLTSRSVLGLLPRGATTEGVVRVNGDDVLTMSPEQLRRLRTDTAAMVFQDPRASINPLRRIGDFLTETSRRGPGGPTPPPHGPRRCWPPSGSRRPRSASTRGSCPAACCNAS